MATLPADAQPQRANHLSRYCSVVRPEFADHTPSLALDERATPFAAGAAAISDLRVSLKRIGAWAPRPIAPAYRSSVGDLARLGFLWKPLKTAQSARAKSKARMAFHRVSANYAVLSRQLVRHMSSTCNLGLASTIASAKTAVSAAPAAQTFDPMVIASSVERSSTIPSALALIVAEPFVLATTTKSSGPLLSSVTTAPLLTPEIKATSSSQEPVAATTFAPNPIVASFTLPVSTTKTPETTATTSISNTTTTNATNATTTTTTTTSTVPVIVATIPATTTTTATTPPTQAPQASGNAVTWLAMVNQVRSQPRSCGTQAFSAAPALVWDARLEEAARVQSSYQMQISTMTHTGAGGSDGGQRITAAGFMWNAWGENVGWNYPNATAMLQGWVNSPGHCHNLMDPTFTQLGWSRVGAYDTMDLARER